MIVKCISNNRSDLTSIELVDAYDASCRVDEVNIKIGGLYHVYGIILRKGLHWYLICEDETSDYPKPHFFAFFIVISGKIPNGWTMGIDRGSFGSFYLVPDEFVRDPSFMEKLVDGDRAAVLKFAEIRREIDELSEVYSNTRVLP